MKDYKEIEKELLQKKKKKLALLKSKRAFYCLLVSSLSILCYQTSSSSVKVQEESNIEETKESNAEEALKFLALLSSMGFLNGTVLVLSRPDYLDKKEKIEKEYEEEIENSLTKILKT